MNAAQIILRDERNKRSFIYSDNCGDFTNPAFVQSGHCPVSYVDDDFSCPERLETWIYRAAPGIPALDDIGIAELLSAILNRSPSATGGRGELVKLIDGQPTPLARAEYKPPCRRAGCTGIAMAAGDARSKLRKRKRSAVALRYWQSGFRIMIAVSSKIWPQYCPHLIFSRRGRDLSQSPRGDTGFREAS